MALVSSKTLWIKYCWSDSRLCQTWHDIKLTKFATAPLAKVSLSCRLAPSADSRLQASLQDLANLETHPRQVQHVLRVWMAQAGFCRKYYAHIRKKYEIMICCCTNEDCIQLICFFSFNRPGICNTCHQRQLCQRCNGAGQIVKKAQHLKKVGRSNWSTCCGTYQVGCCPYGIYSMKVWTLICSNS